MTYVKLKDVVPVQFAPVRPLAVMDEEKNLDGKQ